MLSLVRRLLSDCQQTCITTMGQCPTLARHYFKTNHSSPKYMVFWMIFIFCNTAYSFTHAWGLKARECLRLIFHPQVSPSHHAVHPTLVLGTELSGSPFSSFCHTFSPKISSISKFLIQGHPFSSLHVHYSLSEKLRKDSYLTIQEQA